MKKSSDYSCKNVNRCIVMPQNNDSFVTCRVRELSLFLIAVCGYWCLLESLH